MYAAGGSPGPGSVGTNLVHTRVWVIAVVYWSGEVMSDLLVIGIISFAIGLLFSYLFYLRGNVCQCMQNGE